jgi:hypothetical protein
MYVALALGKIDAGGHKLMYGNSLLLLGLVIARIRCTNRVATLHKSASNSMYKAGDKFLAL